MDLWVLSFTPLRGPQGICLLSTVVGRLEYRKNNCGQTFMRGKAEQFSSFLLYFSLLVCKVNSFCY